ncbi:MAG: GH25 family lysozyme [Oscillospiraceae bacterium]
MALLGPSISEYDGNINFGKIKETNNFVMLRCGFGGNLKEQDDNMYVVNARKCERLKLPYGAFLYSYATSAALAKNEAEHALRLLRDTRPTYGLWYAVEDNSLPIERQKLSEICRTFLSALESEGEYVGIRSSLDWLLGRLDSPELKGYDKWVMQKNRVCEYPEPYTLWQFQDSGKISGVPGTFSMNRGYLDYHRIIAKA